MQHGGLQILLYHTSSLIFNVERVILPRVQRKLQYSNRALNLYPLVSATLCEKAEVDLGVCKLSLILVPFSKVLARMKGKPQPNQKCLPPLRIESESLDHKPQPLTIGAFLTSIPHINYHSTQACHACIASMDLTALHTRITKHAVPRMPPTKEELMRMKLG